jgi:hypothetical protein
MSFVSALDLLDFCYKQRVDQAKQLLTCELQNWSKETCLNLAVAANHLALLAHPCSQIILADLWRGGLRTRKSNNLKVWLKRNYLQIWKVKSTVTFNKVKYFCNCFLNVILCSVYKLYYSITACIVDVHKIENLFECHPACICSCI